MKTMKTFWMDNNLAKIIKNLFPNKNQGEFIRKAVEKSLDLSLKRIWHPVGYATKVAWHRYGTYCFKYYYGFYPKLKRQFIFIEDVEGTSFINAFPESKELVVNELGIAPYEVVDILFRGIRGFKPATIFVSKDRDKQIWNVWGLNNNCVAYDIDIHYKAFVEEYVNAIQDDITSYSKLRYYGARDALGFPVEYDFENYEENHLLNLTGHLGVVDLPDEYKNPLFSKKVTREDTAPEELSEFEVVELENELFSCRSRYLKGTAAEPLLYFSFHFKQNGLYIHPGYKGWQSFCNGILDTITNAEGQLSSVDFDSVYTIIENDNCIFRGMRFDMNIVADNLQLQEFVLKYVSLPQYKQLVEKFEAVSIEWQKTNGRKD